MVVENIASIENMTNSFIKTLSTKFFDDHKDHLGIRCVPNML